MGKEVLTAIFLTVVGGLILITVSLLHVSIKQKTRKRKGENEHMQIQPKTENEKPVYTACTYKKQDGTDCVNVPMFIDMLRKEDPYFNGDTKALIKAAQSMTGLAESQVEMDIFAWIRNHIDESSLRVIPDGEPYWNPKPEEYNNHYPDSDFKAYPCCKRYSLLQKDKNWQEKYHPFILTHSSNPDETARKINSYIDLSVYSNHKYLCLHGYVSAKCMIPYADSLYLESSDKITMSFSLRESAHDGGDWQKEQFSLNYSKAPSDDVAPLVNHTGVPECEQAYVKGDGALLYRPFGLEGWYEIRYTREVGNGWSGQRYSENVINGKTENYT